MKTRIFMAMAAAAAALVSCNREEMDVTEPAGNVFRFELVDGETKATLGETGVLWDLDDELGVFMGTTHGSAHVTEKNGKKYITYPAPSTGDRMVYAYYPYDVTNTDPASVQVSFPASQQGGSVSAMPMAGIPIEAHKGDINGKIYSLNLGSVIDFRVYSTRYAGERIRSIRLTATSGDHPVSGKASLSLLNVAQGNEASLALSWQGGFTPSSVTLSQSASVARNKDAAAEGHLYMVVAPGTYSGEISVVTNVAEYTFTFEDKEFKRNALRRFNMDLDSSGAAREAYYVKTGSAEEGGSFLIVYESSPTEAQVFHPVLSGNNRYTGEAVTAPITDKGILATAEVDACQVVLEKVSGTESDYYIKVPGANDGYLYLSNNSLGTNQNPTTFTFDDNGNVTVSRTTTGWWTSTYYLRYNNASFSSSTTACTLALYKPDDGGLKFQYPRFSEDSFEFSVTGYNLPVANIPGSPTLTGAKTPVTYSSSDTQVATVEATTGQVTVRGVGKTVITAVAEASDEYKPATASYTLKVVDGFCIENDVVAQFLDYVEEHPYYPEDYSYSYVQQYSSQSSSSNRLDLPKPVPVHWETAVSGTATVNVYNDAAHTDLEKTANVTVTSSTSADIYSLIPGRTYYYVVKDGNTQVAQGQFRTTGRRRMIKVGDSPYGSTYANNCRDFGGLPTTSGATLRFGKIYRGTNMDETTANQKTYILDYMGVGLDVDLREQGSGGEKGKYQNDALGLGSMHTTERYDNWQKLSDPERMRGTLTHIFDAVLGEGPNAGAPVGVYIHCKVGADRTAYVCLLLEAILGVPQGICDIDYELTSFCSAVEYNPRRRDRTNQTFYYYTVNGIPHLTGQPGNTFQEKAIYYVTNGLGIPMERITAFQNAMLER